MACSSTAFRAARLAPVLSVSAAVIVWPCFGCLGAATDAEAVGRTIYVSPQGADRNDGSQAAPLASIGYALARVARPGDTVLLRGGVYREREIWLRADRRHGGQPGRMLTVKAFPGEQPVLENCRFILGASYTRIEGLHFVARGIAISGRRGGGHANQIVGNTFTGAAFRYAAIHVSGDHCLIEANTINVQQRTTLDHAIYISNARRITVRNNRILGCQGYGVHIYTEQKTSDRQKWKRLEVKEIVVERNLISGSAQRDGLIIAKGRGGATIELSDITIRNNVFTGNARCHVTVREGEQIRIDHNTFVGGGISLPGPVGGSKPPRDVRIRNNIFVSREGGEQLSCRLPPAAVLLDRNLYRPKLAISTLCDSHALVAKPLFARPAQGDFHLQAASPAVDTRWDVGVKSDFEGRARPAGKGFDLGAFEGDPAQERGCSASRGAR